MIPGGNRDLVAEPRNAAPPPAAPSPADPAADLTTPSIRIAMVLAQVSPHARALACRLLARNDDTARNLATLQSLPTSGARLERWPRRSRSPRRAPSCPSAAAVDQRHLAAVMAKLSPDGSREQALITSLDRCSTR
jgi:hypothetical protein